MPDAQDDPKHVGPGKADTVAAAEDASTRDIQNPGSWDFAGAEGQPLTSSRPRSLRLSDGDVTKRSGFALGGDRKMSPGSETLSPAAADRVFPIRSVVSVDPIPTPVRPNDNYQSYFANASQARRHSTSVAPDLPPLQTSNNPLKTSAGSPIPESDVQHSSPQPPSEQHSREETPVSSSWNTQRQQPRYLQDALAGRSDGDSVKSDKYDNRSDAPSEAGQSRRARSTLSRVSSIDETGGLVTARFKHVVSEGGHAIITGRDGETLQRCEDEPIHIPGAVQGFGLLIALEEQQDQDGKLLIRVVSENAKMMIGYTPKQLFALDSFTDILSEEQTDNLLDHIDFIREDDADLIANGPEVFTLSIRGPNRKSTKLWCAMHISERNPNLVICEFELEEDVINPLVPPNDATPEPPEDTLNSMPTEEELMESTQNASRPLRVLRSARKRRGEAAAMEVFNIMAQVQEQLAAAPNLEKFLKILVGVVKELTGFHRVMIYQFDSSFNGKVVTELVDPRATKDIYKGLNFPASDIPKQARDLYKINKVRMLYDRDQTTARLVCRTMEDLETPLDLTHSYLRAMSPIHLKYLANMAVRSSMSISINAFEELWGLIACHTYGSRGMRVSFPIRKMCRLVGDSASRNIERLSYASRLQARKLINTVPTQANPSGYIIASSEDLLKLFDADFGLLSIRDETKILGQFEQTQEALAMLEYLRMRSITNVMTSQDLKADFPDLRYPPGFQVIAGLLIVPLSTSGQDFIVFFRRGQLKEVKWAGNPYEKFIKEGTEGYLEPRKSFRTWSEKVVGKCREWTEEEIETAAVLCLVYGKFIEVWRQKEAALQNSQLTRLLLANSAHEVRTPLNAIINYLEIALEGTLDNETRENLAKSHSASKSLIYVINDLLDLTKTEEGGNLVKDEIFDLKTTLAEATDVYRGDARRKNISYEVHEMPGLPCQVIGDQRRVRQAISNVTANAIQNTTEGGIKVEMYLASHAEQQVEIEISITDTGAGMSAKKLDSLFREMEQVQSEAGNPFDDANPSEKALPEARDKEQGRTLGLGLAVVARIIRNMNGQLRLKSEEGKGTRFVIQFPFDLPDSEPRQLATESSSSIGSATPLADPISPPIPGEVTLVERRATERPSSDLNVSMSRKNSTESMGKTSLRSLRSAHSNTSGASINSGRSQADRLIEAIQEPHRVEGWKQHGMQSPGSRGGSARPSVSIERPSLEKRHTVVLPGESTGSPRPTRSKSLEVAPVPEHLRDQKLGSPGEVMVTDQGAPIKAIRMPDDDLSPMPMGLGSQSRKPSLGGRSIADTVSQSPTDRSSIAEIDAKNFQVLVAEDDPVNSRIIKKRLERLGHDVYLTVNGEECSTAYCEKVSCYDVILMDMQMPIVDGMTSTKMIRSFEKSHPTQVLSERASLNGRVPIIAVSASLVERDRQSYVDAGFDGWILKPIDFRRLSNIMEGLVATQVRKENLYYPGSWERGGWFEEGQKDIFDSNTAPSGGPPMSDPSVNVQISAVVDDPQAKGGEETNEQDKEQVRLGEWQEEKRVEGEVLGKHEAQEPKEESVAGAESTEPQKQDNPTVSGATATEGIQQGGEDQSAKD
ncbi:hypothetical protein K431DRAFT_305400 [Polychaeton citri CBS 116435]|uniref:Phytochrome n=1 Tax=Polychaeton citri CBS 116435 TaxID=1314669 RepID=A0A9P4Q749_9PEZI|nr:hypothetical protein K431DRAFT_305400 [Polychaeton citri CBS 116435]